MRITLEKHGGLAGLRLPPRTIADASLSPDQRAELIALIEAARNEAPAAKAAADRVRDAMTYVITVDGEAGSAVLKQSDGAITPAFAALLAWVEKFR